MRPVLGIFPVSPALSDPDGKHPASLNPETGLTVDETTESYLLEPATGHIYWVGPAFVTGADIQSAEARSENQGAVDLWVVVPVFTSEGNKKSRVATGGTGRLRDR